MRDGSGWCVATPEEEARANQEASLRFQDRSDAPRSTRELLELRATVCARAGRGEDHESTVQD